MIAGGYDHSRDGLAEGCCSAMAPCSHQQRSPSTICKGCTEASAIAAKERLTAAAPDLLEALKGVVRVADRRTVEFDAARAAIARAEDR